jgi:hypothetical protein
MERLKSWFVGKPDKSPGHFPAGFHFGDYGVSQALAILLMMIPTHSGQHTLGLKLMFPSKLQEPKHLA